MQESKGHRKFDRQFKEEAVRLVTEGGRSVTDVAHGLGIHFSVHSAFSVVTKINLKGI